MFTIEQIQSAEQKVETGADFPQLAKDLKDLGVQRFDVFVMNGMTVYYGANDNTAEGEAVYETLMIDEQSSVDDLKEALKVHQQGASDYQTFCKQAAMAGVEKWIVDLQKMTVTYLDTAGAEMVVEDIPAR
ncbi:DUF1398 domain-containing protein [Pedobacter namyangjuensis]|uniref:DUF1398 domain-containing protein n=1 Tax=Pedobacter namyangjuensis TaxID=600626 RepID=UPI000DE311F6|nr:DUF1398 family protein [Pedobacter namyangjuensis]